MDWKVYGRTDRLYTKLYVPEQEETVCFVLDRSASMKSKWSYLQTVVLGLATVSFAQGDRVALRYLPRLERPPESGMAPIRGRSGLARVAQFLEQASPEGVSDLDAGFDELSRRMKGRSHLVIVSDFLKEGAGARGLAQLHYRRHRLTLLQLLSPEEADPEAQLSPGEWELYDPEPDTPDPLRDTVRLDLGRSAFAAYRQTLVEHNGELVDFARRTGAVYVSALTSTPLPGYFSQSLRQGGLLL